MSHTFANKFRSLFTARRRRERRLAAAKLGPSGSGRMRRIQFESLESRLLLSTTYTVLNTATSGAGSLRQAVLDANANSGADLISFNIPANDANHVYYKNDGIAGQVTITLPLGVPNIITTTASDDSTIADIDPDWAHSWYRIKPTSALPIPAVTGAVTIDGYTQPGSSANTLANGDNAVHRIQLDVSLTGSGGVGITIASGASTVRGLAFNSGGHGVKLQTLGGNVIEGNYFGTDISGTIDRGASGYGIWVLGSSDNLIGGTTLAARNLIAGNNAAGIFIADSTTPAANNVVAGNFIGTNAAGTAAISNNVAGVYINDAQHNLVGGTAPGAGNLLSGNLRGVYIQGAASAAVEGFNVVEGNLIGTDVTGIQRLFNGIQGVFIQQSDNNRIGGTTAAARNIISGNGQQGIQITGNPNAAFATGNLVEGNWIGVDATGNGLLGNGTGTGIAITFASNTQVGGTAPGAGNLIPYNQTFGISISSSFDTVVQGNVIGQTLNGSPAGHFLDGIRVGGSQGTLIGGDVPGAGNVITRGGRDFGPNATTGGPSGVFVQDDVLPLAWLRAEGNARDSVAIPPNNGTLEGGTGFAQGRFGYAFSFDGVDDYVNLPDRAFNHTGTLDQGLQLSIDAWIRPNDVNSFQQIVSKFGSGGDAYQLGLAPNGVLRADLNVGSVSIPNIQTLQSPANAVVAGQWTHVAMTFDTNPRFWRLYVNGVEVASQTTSVGVINSSGTTPVSIGRKSDGTQYFNGLIDEPAFYENTVDIPAIYALGGANKWHGTTIRGNSIYHNGYMGIDLRPLGPNTNDADDTDVGANDLQNTPLLTSATSTGADTTVQGTLRSIAFTSYAIEVFASTDPEQYYVQGERLIGTGIAVTDATGVANFSFTFPVGVPAGEFISATATVLHDHDANPNTPLASFDTSEFNTGIPVVTLVGGTISGHKFNDLDSDAVWDAGEPALPGWIIFLDANDNGEFEFGETRSTTDTTGRYSFHNLAAGTYRVREMQQAGWMQTTPNGTTLVVNPQSSPTYVVDIGNVQVGTVTSGVKFHDLDGDAIHDPNEPGLAGFMIYLDTNSNDQMDSGETRTTTAANGEWSFTDLPVGTYEVREVQQPGWEQTTPPLDVTTNGQSLFAGAIGNYRLATISGVKFNDRNDNGTADLGEPGLAGWTIFLDANDSGTLDIGETSTTTAVTGAYSFDVPDGTYRVREVQQATWIQTTDNVVIEVLPNQSAQTYIVDVGNFRPSSIIGGLKFHDLNGNGVRDVAEPVLQGWVIELDADVDGTVNALATTGTNGEYTFTGLPVGTYRIREAQQPGWVQTTDDPEDILIVEGGQIIDGPDFGNYHLATIGGGSSLKFNDLDNDGILDPGEPGLPNWTFYLDADGDDQLDVGEVSTLTNITGHYSFSGLEAGTYRVREVQQPDWSQTTPQPADIVVLAGVSGQTFSGPTFGNHLNGPCVINTNNSGPGSLRQAMLDANATVGIRETICFNIPTSDPGYDPGRNAFTISPLTPLPTVTDSVKIDGYTQPGSVANTAAIGDDAVINIELDGSLAGNSHGLYVTAGNSTVKGLAINRFNVHGIRLENVGGNVIQGNFIGIDTQGTQPRDNVNTGISVYLSNNNLIGSDANGVTDAAERNIVSANTFGIILQFSHNNVVAGNYVGTDRTGTTNDSDGNPLNGFDLASSQGIAVSSGTFNTIGGLTAAARNVVSGNLYYGIHIQGNGNPSDSGADHNTVQGNLIGTDATGTLALGNGGYGIWVNANANLIGGATDAARNVVSANGAGVGGDGIGIFGYSNVVHGNYVGTDVTGTLNLGNQGPPQFLLGNGINITGGTGNQIGGVAAGQGNLIAYSKGAGVMVTGATQVGNSIRGNSIHTNDRLGIDLTSVYPGPPGSTANDLNDVDIGPNGFQNFPLLATVSSTMSGTNIVGTLNSTPDTTFTLDFYSNVVADASGFGEGKTYLGSATVNTDGSGNASFVVTVAGVATVGHFASATATGPSGTSEFSGTTVVVPGFVAATIAGQKYNDLDGDGVKDPGESGLSGWTIFIDSNLNGAHDGGESFAITNGSGNYSLTGPSAGTYRIREVPQSGWVQTSPNPDDVVITASGSVITDVDFGNFRLGSIDGGVKFHDLNRNGQQDASEPGLQGFLIYLDDNNDGQRNAFEPTSITDANGNYSFSNLPAGTYHIREHVPGGWVQSTALLDVTLTTSGQSVSGGKIGNYHLATISGVKFLDNNSDGIRQVGEPGLAGWTIYLDANANGSFDNGEAYTQSGGFGLFSFDNLDAGTYILREVQQPGWMQTTLNPAPIVIAPNISNQSYAVEFGNFQHGVLEGVKFHDLNRNGLQDSGEPGLPNFTIFLDADGDDSFDSGERWTLSGATGEFSFSGLAAGTYHVREVVPTGWVQTTPPIDIPITSSGQLAEGKIGNYRLATISGAKFNDLNGDGDPDLGEPGLEGWTIFLDGNDNGELDGGETSTVTGFAGAYSFGNLDVGTYRVREVQQPGWTQTSANVTTVVLSNQSAQSYVVNVGNFRLGSIVDGVKYHDLDGDGVQDANEPGLPGWTIYLDTNGNEALDSGERRTTSGIDGLWSFSNLPAGTYPVREVQEAGWRQTSAPYALTLTSSGQELNGGAIGNYQLATISGVKFNDLNSDGIHQFGEPGLEGWTIFLDANDDGALDGGEVSTVTGFTGAYSFGNLDAGTYRVREVQQPGWAQTSPNVTTVVLPNQSAQSYVVNVGNFHLGSASGVKFHDLNGDGLRDANELGLLGWTIYLDANGNETLDGGEARTVSDGDGDWSFGNLAAGTYHVREVQRNGWIQTSAPLNLALTTSGQSLVGAIGNYQLATINGVKFNDVNGDGIYQIGEPELANWTIFLDANGNGELDGGESSTTTDLFGHYSFDRLTAGTYRVREVQQPGWTQTSANVTTEVLEHQSAQSYLVNVGNFRLGSAGGVKFHDLNGDGLRDANEPGLPGWTIYLDDNGSETLDVGETQTITDGNGNWSFGNLAAGAYHVREVQQNGWLQTSAPLDLPLTTSGQSLVGEIGNFRLANINGVKFNDLDGDGSRDAGEPGIEGWQIFLDLDSDDALDTNERSTFTNASGVYTFTNVGKGTWFAREVQDPGWLQTTLNPPGVTVTASQQTFSGGDFGNKQGSLSGWVYLDVDNDSVLDVDEDGIPDVSVTLIGTDDLGPVNRTILTGTDGFYKFGGLRPGSYQIVETQPSGYLDGKDTLGSLGDTAANDQFFVDLEKGEDGTDYDFGELPPAKLSGYVYNDVDDDGLIDFGEQAIPGAQIALTGTNDLNEIINQMVTTDTQGYYEFGDLRPGTYTIHEQQPAGYTDGKDTIGTLGGMVTNDQFSNVGLTSGSNGLNYNFGEHIDNTGNALRRGQTATIGYWQNKNGQALIQSLNGGANSTNLGNWLASNFANMYGANAGANNLAGKTNAQVAAFYISLFKQKGQKLDAQVMAAAFAVYVTDSDLASTNASQYGFIVNSAGTGAATFSVGSSGAAFGVANNTQLTILQILTATNVQTAGGNLYSGNQSLRNLAILVYDGINQGGDIL